MQPVANRYGLWNISKLEKKTVKIDNSFVMYNASGWLYTETTTGKLVVVLHDFDSQEAANWAIKGMTKHDAERSVELKGEVFPLYTQLEYEWKCFTRRTSTIDRPRFRGLIVDGYWVDSYEAVDMTEAWPFPSWEEGGIIVNKAELYQLWLDGKVQ